MSSRYSIIVTAEQAGERLDKILSQHADIQTRNRAAHLIEKKMVQINGKNPKPSYCCKENDIIHFEVQKNETNGLVKFDFKLDIIFEDSELLVINKPSGLVVHPAAGHSADTLVNALINYTDQLSMKFGEIRPGIVHRIDKETSGLLVVAKNDSAHLKLSEQFKNKTSHRKYQAVVIGTLPLEKGTISSYLLRHPTDRKKYASIRDSDKKIIQLYLEDIKNGKWAVTHFKKIASKHGLSLLELNLETGRTHQIRIHLSEKGFPIIGDSLYGADKKLKSIESSSIRETIKNIPRFYLHAAELGFFHPTTNQWMQFSVDWPKCDLENIHSWGLMK